MSEMIFESLALFLTIKPHPVIEIADRRIA
ncbi:protein of unknown function [Methylorubrum extorquens]|uniref:Uncharacterized protein n=1 Tax=Methylorubrum extorquens TaxID=408 RepID=A0A2N9AVQ5_METEX|nr:protein of unknown function [Methylorubrum extorquens]